MNRHDSKSKKGSRKAARVSRSSSHSHEGSQSGAIRGRSTASSSPDRSDSGASPQRKTRRTGNESSSLSDLNHSVEFEGETLEPLTRPSSSHQNRNKSVTSREQGVANTASSSGTQSRNSNRSRSDDEIVVLERRPKLSSTSRSSKGATKESKVDVFDQGSSRAVQSETQELEGSKRTFECHVEGCTIGLTFKSKQRFRDHVIARHPQIRVSEEVPGTSSSAGVSQHARKKKHRQHQN